MSWVGEVDSHGIFVCVSGLLLVVACERWEVAWLPPCQRRLPLLVCILLYVYVCAA